MTEINETFEHENAWHREWAVMQLEIQKLNKAIARKNRKIFKMKERIEFYERVMMTGFSEAQKGVMYNNKPLRSYFNV